MEAGSDFRAALLKNVPAHVLPFLLAAGHRLSLTGSVMDDDAGIELITVVPTKWRAGKHLP